MKIKKEIFLVIFVVAVFILTGCNKNHEIENSEEKFNLPSSGSGLTDDVQVVELDVEKYKLSDNYYISGESLGKPFIETETRENTERTFEFESDGAQHEITHKMNESETDKTDEYSYYSNKFDTKLDGETVKFSGGEIDTYTYFGATNLDFMWLIDLDEKDQYKEMVIKRIYGLDSLINIYRITKDGMKLIFSIGNDWNELVKINNKWVFTDYRIGYFQNVTIGFYIYEDGEFKYVDRMATGEKIRDEEGMFPKEFQKLEFTSDGETSSVANLGKCTFNLIASTDNYKYTIRLTEDAKDYDGKILPAGTILEDVGIAIQW